FGDGVHVSTADARALAEAHPAFRDALAASDAALERLGASVRVGALLDGAAHPARERALAFAMQTALAATLRSFWLSPETVSGSGVGALAARYASGAMSLEDAWRRVLEASPTRDTTDELRLADGDLRDVVALGEAPELAEPSAEREPSGRRVLFAAQRGED